MKLFLDTASLEEIQKWHAFGIIDGVTTNPSLIAAEGLRTPAKARQHYKAICDLVKDQVSVEVIATDTQTMLDEARALATIDKKIVVKVPMLPASLPVIQTLSKERIRTNCTLVFNAAQAFLAAKAGATFVSPFIGRVDDIGYDGLDSIAAIKTIFMNYGFETQILCASVRHSMHFIRCAELGADVVTCSGKLLHALMQHPLTDRGLEKFLSDYKTNVAF